MFTYNYGVQSNSVGYSRLTSTGGDYILRPIATENYGIFQFEYKKYASEIFWSFISLEGELQLEW